MRTESEVVAIDDRVPAWVQGAHVAAALQLARADDIVFVQRRRDGVVLVAILPVTAVAPAVRAVLERSRTLRALGAMRASPFRRALVALDVDGTTAVLDAMGSNAQRGIA